MRCQIAGVEVAPGEDAVPVVVRHLRAHEPACGAVRVLAVDGPSGAGKTTLASALARALGLGDDQTVRMDDLYPGWDGLADAVPLLVARVLEPLSRNLTGRYRRWDWYAGAWGPEVVVQPGPWLLVEGCGAMVGPAGPYATTRVWVEAPPDVRMARGLERDGETYRPHWERWRRQEQAVFGADRTRERADVIVTTA